MTDKFEIADIKLRLDHMEEQQLQMNALFTYIFDKQSVDVNAILTMLFTIDGNIDIIRENLVNPSDSVILDRVVDKWKKSVVVNEEPKLVYSH